MKRFKEFLLKVGENIYQAFKNGWFPYFILLSLLSTPLHAQTERAQKQAKVIEQRQRSQPQYNPNNNTNHNRPRPIPRVYRPYYYNPMVWGYTPYWNPHRTWDGREYIITTDNEKVSPLPPLRVSLGVLSEVTTQQPSVGPYLTLGGKTFGIIQYQWGGWNSFPYYDNIYPWEVEEWEDVYINTQEQRREFSLGLGTTIKRLSPFIGVGFPTITKWDIYEDETFTLSSPRDLGYYAINQRVDRRVNLKLGLLYGWERIEGVIQVSAFEGLSFGDGLRIGMGIGIKL